MTEILARYLRYNAHAASYTWKYDSRNLDMDKTLEENGIPDEDEEFYKLSMNDDTFLQAIHLYFNDDLTEAWTFLLISACKYMYACLFVNICTINIINEHVPESVSQNQNVRLWKYKYSIWSTGILHMPNICCEIPPP